MEPLPVPELGTLNRPPSLSADPGEHYSSPGVSCPVSRGLFPPPRAADGGRAGSGFKDWLSVLGTALLRCWLPLLLGSWGTPLKAAFHLSPSG